MTIAWAVLGVAVFTGLLGGVHCMGMCGGIVSALTTGTRATGKPWAIPLAYNLGRIASYAIAGAIAGAVGSLGMMLQGLLPVQLALYVLANLLLIGLGLYLAGIPGPIARIERLGSHLWALLKPHTRHFLPMDTLPRAVGVGMLWGWLPCGLVYTVLFGALLSGDALSGAALMLAFGLGTLPNLMAAALLLRRSRAWLASRPARLVSGSVVLGFGVWGLAHATSLSQQIKSGLICIG